MSFGTAMWQSGTSHTSFGHTSRILMSLSRISLTAESFDWPNLIRYSWPNSYKTNSGQWKSCRQVQDNCKLFSFSEMSRLHLNYQQILLTITKSLSITIISL